MPPESRRVAYLGPEGTYTHQAALAYFGDQWDLLPCETITATLQTLLTDAFISHAILPLRNSSNGPVKETQDLLASPQGELVQELGTVQLDIQHVLMRRHDATASVSVIASHEQALGQCRNYLLQHYPDVKIIRVNSTAAAAKYTLTDGASAAIGPALAAELYQLQVVDRGAAGRGIQDAQGNATTFGVFQRKGSNEYQGVPATANS